LLLGFKARLSVLGAVLSALVLVLVLASDANACSCIAAPIEERLEQADGAIIGRVVDEEIGELRGARQRLLTIEVDQRIKGDVEKTLLVRSPLGTSCDVELPKDEVTGLLLTRAPDGAWLATTCSIVDENQLVAAGGEPRGGVIQVVLGVLVLALVLSWALRRRARGTRPSLPGAPEP
jgi:MYXO-CTERM domain-containing protein